VDLYGATSTVRRALQRIDATLLLVEPTSLTPSLDAPLVVSFADTGETGLERVVRHQLQEVRVQLALSAVDAVNRDLGVVADQPSRQEAEPLECARS
jgi:hypothetical protein